MASFGLKLFVKFIIHNLFTICLPQSMWRYFFLSILFLL